MGETEGGAGIEAQIADLRVEADMACEFGFPDSGKVMDDAATALKAQQARIDELERALKLTGGVARKAVAELETG